MQYDCSTIYLSANLAVIDCDDILEDIEKHETLVILGDQENLNDEDTNKDEVDEKIKIVETDYSFPFPEASQNLLVITNSETLNHAHSSTSFDVSSQQILSSTLPEPGTEPTSIILDETAVKVSSPPSVPQPSNSSLLKTNNCDPFSKFKVPWPKMPQHIIDQCKKNMKLNPTDYGSFIHIIVIEMRSISNYIRKKVFENVANDVIAKFPKTFQQIDSDGVLVSNGTHRVTMKLIDHNSYLNRPHKGANSASDLKKNISKLRVQEKKASGSINHQPNIDIEGDEVDVIDKQINSNMDVYSFEDMVILLIKNFPSHRMLINVTINLQQIFEHLPILRKNEYYLWHYNHLLNHEHDIDNIDKVFIANQEKILRFARKSKMKSLQTLCNSWKNDYVCCLKDAIDIFLLYFKNENHIYKKYPPGTTQSEIFHEDGHPLIAEIGKLI